MFFSILPFLSLKGMMREETERTSRSIPGYETGVTGTILEFLIMGQFT